MGFWYAEYERWRKRDILRESHLSIKVERRKHFNEKIRLWVFAYKRTKIPGIQRKMCYGRSVAKGRGRER